MKIRWKLLILLLMIALLPLILSGVLHHFRARRLGQHLAAGRREILTDSARRQLRFLVEDYGRILRRDQHVLELALKIQAREVERRLAGPVPAKPVLIFSADYDKGVNVPDDLTPSNRHFRPGPDGKPARVPVSYSQQVCFIAAGVGRQAVADDLARLSTMPAVYRDLRQPSPELMVWQYTSLASGIHTSYPGHGGYPPEYDPRQRRWYVDAEAAGELIWLPPIVDVNTRTIILTLAVPVRRGDGSFAGVTAIDLPLTGIFEELKLPAKWAGYARILFVVPGEAGKEGADKLVILAQRSYQDARQNWQATVKLEFLTADDPQDLAALRADATAGRSGVRKMRHRGRQALWAYGAGGGGDTPFPIVIVPYETVVAQATHAEQYVMEKTVRGLEVTGAILLCVAVLVTIVASITSRSVTRPVRQLAQAAERLAGGDYTTRVDIRTRDELEELGEAFNDMGPKLAERERMKRSLAAAMEIQQHLLPTESPQLPGFDIAGESVYCDETGGDYYDFIDLVGLGPNKLAIAVGDVSGHGVAAALLMASARAVLRSHAGRHGTDLGQLFGALNRHLLEDTAQERFITLFYGVLDAETRTLRWTSGGHDPAFWVKHASGQVEQLPNTGLPLGIIEDATYDQAGPITLGHGDIVVVGTDGIWEARNPRREMFGKRRLLELLSRCSDKSASEIHAAIVQAVNDFCAPAPQEDDITLVVAKAL